MLTQPQRARAQLPVLHVDRGRLEWLDRDAIVAGAPLTAELDVTSPRDVAEGAVALLGANGRKPDRCLLALGDAHMTQRVAQFADVPTKDLRRVLGRKAASLLGEEPENVLFSATSMAVEEREPTRRWMLQVVRRSEIDALLHELERVGFRVARVFGARQAVISSSFLPNHEAPESSTSVVLAIENRAVSISLLEGDTLVQQTLVPGNFESQPALAAALVQELRGIQGYWRKVSRGSSIDQVVAVGFTHADGERFKPAIQAALPGCEFTVVGGDRVSGTDAARLVYLQLCRSGSRGTAEMTPSRPAKKKLLLAGLAIAAGAGVVGGMQVRSELVDASSWRRTHETHVYEQTQDVEDVREILEQVDQARGRYLAERAAIEGIGSAGRSMAGIISDVLTAFGQRATLESLTLDPTQGGLRLALTGTTDPDPGRSMDVLDALVVSLESSLRFADVQLLPPSDLPTSGSESGGLQFRVEARLVRDAQ